MLTKVIITYLKYFEVSKLDALLYNMNDITVSIGSNQYILLKAILTPLGNLLNVTLKGLNT